MLSDGGVVVDDGVDVGAVGGGERERGIGGVGVDGGGEGEGARATVGWDGLQREAVGGVWRAPETAPRSCPSCHRAAN